MGKYKYAIKSEIRWLKEDIRITEDCISGKEKSQYSKTELELRKIWAIDELARLNILMDGYDGYVKSKKET